MKPRFRVAKIIAFHPLNGIGEVWCMQGMTPDRSYMAAQYLDDINDSFELERAFRAIYAALFEQKALNDAKEA